MNILKIRLRSQSDGFIQLGKNLWTPPVSNLLLKAGSMCSTDQAVLVFAQPGFENLLKTFRGICDMKTSKSAVRTFRTFPSGLIQEITSQLLLQGSSSEISQVVALQKNCNNTFPVQEVLIGYLVLLSAFVYESLLNILVGWEKSITFDCQCLQQDYFWELQKYPWLLFQ